MTANAVPHDAACTRCVALKHLVEEQAGQIDRLERNVQRLTEKLAEQAMAVHSDPDPV